MANANKECREERGPEARNLDKEMQKASQRGLKTYMTEQPCSVHKGEGKLKAWEIREKNQQRAGFQFPEQNPHSVVGPGNIYIVTRGGYTRLFPPWLRMFSLR